MRIFASHVAVWVKYAIRTRFSCVETHFFTFAYSNMWKKRAYSVLIFNRIALRVYMMVNIHTVRNVKVKDRYTTLRSSLDCKSRSDTLIANFRTLRFFHAARSFWSREKYNKEFTISHIVSYSSNISWASIYWIRS